MKKERILEILSKFKDKKILLFCDLILDFYIWGIPERVSREAPVLILKKKEEWAVPGGGANVLMNLKALKANPLPVGVLGEDEEGKILIDIFKKNKICTDFIKILKGYKTNKKVRILAGFESTSKQQVVRYDEEVFYPEIDSLKINFNEFDCLLISDYGYTPFNYSFIKKSKFNIPVIVDSRHRLKDFKKVTSLTPNIEEAEELTGKNIANEKDAIEASNEILKLLEPEAVLMTMGSRGILINQKNKNPLIIPAHGKGQVADTTGAGDTVLATYSLSISAGASFEEAAFISNIAGGLKVRKMGTATVSYEELENEVKGLS